MTRLAAAFNKNRAALITFIMGGDPDLRHSYDVLKSVADAGADIIEIGMPFSDPMADGPVIEEAGLRALKAGASLQEIIHMVAQFREENKTTPIILMGYYNPIFHYGVKEFFLEASKAGADGMIIVDLPPEEEGEVIPYAEKYGLALIKLVAPTTDDKRLPKVLKNARGFVYYISMAGITGAAAKASEADLKKAVARIRKHTKLPIAVGFGIKTPEQVKAAGKYADGVVVGSALVNIIAQNHNKPAEAAGKFVGLLAAAK